MFRFIITNTFTGSLQGTNNAETAHSLSECEDFFVYDSEKKAWLSMGEYVEIPEIES